MPLVTAVLAKEAGANEADQRQDQSDFERSVTLGSGTRRLSGHEKQAALWRAGKPLTRHSSGLRLRRG